MDFVATQAYEDEDEKSVPKEILGTLDEEESIQVGTLNINSIEYVIKRGITKIGRINTCDIAINDATVSKVHAEIEANTDGESVLICDLDSSNKTKLNNSILRPSRLYELKDGSTIKFGKVHATYRTYRPLDHILVPETPSPSLQGIARLLIPSTPDSSFDKSSSAGNNVSIISGTPSNEKNSVFRKPMVSQQRHSTSIDEKSTSQTFSINENITRVLHMSESDDAEEVSLFDMETQTFEEYRRTNTKSINDLETEQSFTNASEGIFEVNAKTSTRLSKINTSNETTESSVMNIQNMETQNYIDYMHKMQMQKPEINKSKTQIKDTNQDDSNIYDLETQKINTKGIAENIFDMNTQLEFNKTTSDKKSPASSRCSSPGFLNLSSPGIGGDCPYSPSNQSVHLLESSDLLDFGIEKKTEEQANTSILKSPSKKSSDILKSENYVRNISNASNNDDDDDNIFDALTQNVCEAKSSNNLKIEKRSGFELLPSKISKKDSRSNETDDSETDAEEYLEELAKKSRSSLESLNRSCNETSDNVNDLGTSADSEDMFNIPTQQSKDQETQVKQLQNVDKTVANDAISKQNTDKIGSSKTDETNTNNTISKQVVLPGAVSSKAVANSKDRSLKSNQNDESTQFSDHEDIDYEMAPTQLIGEIEENQKNKVTKYSNCKQITKSSKINLNDSLEQNLNKMFDDVNNEDIQEPPQISTQSLEEILQSSQCNDYLPSINKSIVNRDTVKDNTLQAQVGKKSRTACTVSSRNISNAILNKANLDKTEITLQDSDIYFSNNTTKRKKNILKDTQEVIQHVENVISQEKDFSRMPKANNIKDNNTATNSGTKKKRMSKSKDKFDITDSSNIDSINDVISNTIIKQKRTVLDTKQIQQQDSCKLRVDIEKESMNESSENEHAQSAKMYESDDDILTRLPAVRISGTSSNPSSPSCTLTSPTHNIESKQNTSRDRTKKGRILKNKSINQQNIEDSEEEENLNQSNINSPSDDHLLTVNFDSLKTDKISDIANISEDSDNETIYKRFKQVADRMLNNKLKEQNKGNIQTAGKSRKKNKTCSSTLKKAEEDTIIESGNSLQTNMRALRYSNRRNMERSIWKDMERKCVVHITKEIHAENTCDKSKKQKTKTGANNKKRSLNVTKKDTEQTNLKKRKANQVIETSTITQQASNISEHSRKTSLRKKSSMAENIKSLEGNKIPKIILEDIQILSQNTIENTESRRSKRIRQANNNQDTIHNIIVNKNSNKEAQAKRRKTESGQTQDNITQALSNSVVGQESQEVEIIMKRTLDNVQDKHLLLRQSNNTKTLEKKLRTKIRKHSNTNIETNSTPTENTMLSNIDDSINIQPSNTVSKTKREQSTKNSISLSMAQLPPKKRETFKNLTRSSRYAAFDSSIENSNIEDNRDRTENDNYNVSNSRLLRSKIFPIEKTEEIKINRSMRRNQTIDNNSSSEIDTSNIEIASLSSMSSRTRRSVSSVLNNSSPFAMKYKILFTGITEEKYSKIVKMLGGNKVETPAQCTILVTDKVRRTYKFLCALAKGVPIVAIDWLKDSESAAHFLDWQSYILKDLTAETKFGFKLTKSLDRAKETRLLEGYTVVLTSNIAQPPIKELKNMVMSCGGKVLLRPPTIWPEKAVIVTCEEDLPNVRKFLTRTSKKITVQSTEFILTGILRQETDFVRYKLM